MALNAYLKGDRFCPVGNVLLIEISYVFSNCPEEECRTSGAALLDRPKHLRRILPIHAINPVPPVQRIGQALPQVTGVAFQWGSE